MLTKIRFAILATSLLSTIALAAPAMAAPHQHRGATNDGYPAQTWQYYAPTPNVGG
jgi:hypothetical protein